MAKTFSNTIDFINVPAKNIKTAVRIENPMKKLVGIQQRVKVESNVVYRLSGTARSTITNDPNIIFGGRLALFLPGQKEKQIIWMLEHNQWWKKELIFTNQITGTATIYVHMGYGNVASTGEFTNIRLEKIEGIKIKKQNTKEKLLTNDFNHEKRTSQINNLGNLYNGSLTQIVCLVKSKTNIFYNSVWKKIGGQALTLYN